MRETNPRILLAVTGGIAAYKAPELVRMLQKSGCVVRCMMTESATEFVSSLVLETLSGERVARTLWGEGSHGTEHIEWARWPDLVVVAPATAQTLARFAHGLADDFVSTVVLATRAPVLLAPAMNTAMWENPATRANMALLRERGFRVVEPESGVLACGEEGAGKLAELDTIHARALELVAAAHSRRADGPSPSAPQDWSNRTVLITAGPTRTAIDAVRYITNPSTGLMARALAEEALRRGATVHYVLGIDKGVVRPRATTTAEASRLHLVEVQTAAEMLDASRAALPSCEGVIATAAVMDYEVAEPSTGKLKRSSEEAMLRLRPAPDVLATLKREARPGQWFLGFAAETDSVAQNGVLKLARKSLDFVFANPVARLGEPSKTGFGSSSNSGFWIGRNPAGGEPLVEEWPLLEKGALASRILTRLRDAVGESAHPRT